MVVINWVNVRKGLILSLILWLILQEVAGDVGAWLFF